MEDLIRKVVLRIFPALSAGYHLPRFAKVESITEPVPVEIECQPERPYYAVDLLVLTEHGEPDPAFPLLRDVPLPSFWAGAERGLYGKPSVGTWVELAFAYGSPNRPFIRTILPHDLVLAELPEGAQRWQQTAKAYQQIDQDNNWTRTTDATTLEQCKNYAQEVQEVAQRLANLKQIVKVKNGGTVWLGNEANNVLQILDDTINLIGKVASSTAGHTHPSACGGTGGPTTAGAHGGQASEAGALSSKLVPMIE